ncbi:hypothetical protein RESH_03830 [Rhodopirellula europaea SH398]|uniref:Uncharacterized protein n=1 Tax=Rhodopirellula europaea SH398 TaxID=1263868 RepID=M5SD72_9BACT|nr:hypothetical protein RESH_03830 [Rhodopirellula europaea SH398]
MNEQSDVQQLANLSWSIRSSPLARPPSTIAELHEQRDDAAAASFAPKAIS